jgi:hypothetical protein
MDTKKPWLSKTIMLNSIMAILGVVAVFWPHASVATEFLSGHGTEIGVAWSVLNVLLRAVTKDAISLTD